MYSLRGFAQLQYSSPSFLMLQAGSSLLTVAALQTPFPFLNKNNLRTKNLAGTIVGFPSKGL